MSPKQDTAAASNYISEAEAAAMRQMGLKHVRLCVAPKVIMDRATAAVREECAQFLEAAIRRFQRAGLLVVVDIHNEERAVEQDPAWPEAFIQFWRALAARLSKFDPEWIVLEIINEPVFDNHEAEWNVLNGRLAGAIRHSAPQHTIIVSGPNWGGIDGLRKLTPLADKNVIYSFHAENLASISRTSNRSIGRIGFAILARFSASSTSAGRSGAGTKGSD